MSTSRFVGQCAGRLLRVALLAVLATAVPVLASAQATITGSVTNASTSAGISGVTVYWCSTNGSSTSCITTNTDSSGNYTWSGPAGTYYGYTFQAQGFVNEIYDNIQCPGSCSSFTATQTGTPVTVAAGATSANRNFALDVGATIAGTLTDAATSSPIANTGVYVYYRLSTGGVNYAAFGFTDSSGNYSVNGLPTGTYFVFTSSSVYINELYNNIACPGSCFSLNSSAITAGTAVSATAGSTTGNINFALDMGGMITGTVRRSSDNAPLSSVTVSAYTRLGTDTFLSFAGSGFTNTSGAFTIGGLPTGSYFIFTSNSQGYINEYYDNIQCLGSCSTSSSNLSPGTPVSVTAGATVSGRDFALDLGGSITGTVTTSAGAPLGSWGVTLYANSSGSAVFVGSASTNSTTGTYTIRGLPTGTYYAATSGSGQNLVNEIFDNIPCVGSCSSANIIRGTAIAVTAGATGSPVNFALDVGGAIAGTVTTGASTPVPGSVTIYTKSGTSIIFAGSASVNATTGAYTITGLPTGTYWAAAFGSSAGFVNEIYNDIPCLGSCSTSAIVGGTPIAVTAGATTSNTNFSLVRGGGISGTIRNAATTEALAGISVSIYTSTGASFPTFVTSASTNSSGIFEANGLPAGTYWAYTSGAQGFGLSNQIFNGVACPGSCGAALAVSTGTPIAVALGATAANVNFNLPGGGSISGTVTNASSSAPLVGAAVLVYTRVGSAVVFAGSASTNSSGIYTVTGLPAGSYYAYTSVSGFQNKIFDIPACPTSCSPAEAVNNGTAIPVTAGATTGGRNFSLTPLNLSTAVPGVPGGLTATVTASTVTFSWFAPGTAFAGAATSYAIDVGFAPGTTIISFTTTATTFTRSGVPPGTFYARVRALNANGSSAPSADVRFSVGASGEGVPTAPTGLVAYVVGTRLYVSWTAPTSGGTATGYVLEVGASTGSSNIATLPVSSTLFTYDNPPPGFYFIRVRATNSGGTSDPSTEVMLVVGAGATPPEAPTNFTGSANASRTVTLSWTAPRGTVTGYILEAGSAPGLSDIATVSLGTATTIQFANVPPGTYYIRVRAVNALGRSVATPDGTLVIR